MMGQLERARISNGCWYQTGPNTLCVELAAARKRYLRNTNYANEDGEESGCAEVRTTERQLK